MTDYRFYFLNAADKIEAAQHEELPSDAEAIAKAQTALNGYTITDTDEVWAAKRFVARVTRNNAHGNNSTVD